MITLKVEVEQNTIVQHVIKEASILSRNLNIAIEFEYHNTSLRVSPTTIDANVFTYWKSMNQQLVNSVKQSKE